MRLPLNSNVQKFPTFGIAVFHGLGDVLNLTPLASQLRSDHPEARITWFTSRACAPALEGNPHLDEIVILDGDPILLDRQIPSLAHSRPWSQFFDPAPYRNYQKVPGGSLWDLYRASWRHDPKAPLVPVMRLTDEEIHHATTWWNSLPKGPRILLECDARSQQTQWNADAVGLLVDALGSANPLFVVSAQQPPREVERFRALGARVVYCGRPWRENAIFYNLADAFIGISSGISALSGSDLCRSDLPSVEYVRGEHWSTAGLGRHSHRRYAFSERRFQECLRALAFEIQGCDNPVFHPRTRILDLSHEDQPVMSCPICDSDAPKSLFDEETALCGICQQVYRRTSSQHRRLEHQASKVGFAIPLGQAVENCLPLPIKVAEALFGNDFVSSDVSELHLIHIGEDKRVLSCAYPSRQVIDEVPGPFKENSEPLWEPIRILGQWADLISSDLKPGTVDGISFINSLDQAMDPLTELEKASFVLREGGLLGVVVPNLNRPTTRSAPSGLERFTQSDRYIAFTLETLRSLILQAGFELLSSATYGEPGKDASVFPARPGTGEDKRGGLESQQAPNDGDQIWLLARKSGPFKGRKEPGNPPERILVIRTDSLGDVLLSNTLIEPIAQHWPAAKIVVVCQERCAPLIEGCPWVSQVVSFDRSRAIEDPNYLKDLMVRVRRVGADLCLNPVHSREALGDELALASGSATRIAFSGDLCNMSAQEHEVLDRLYTRLIPPLPTHAPELDRHAAFLDALEIPHPTLAPRLWLSDRDRAAGLAVLQRFGIQPNQFLAAFPGAQHPHRIFSAFAEALAPVLVEHPLPVLTLGGPNDVDLCERLISSLPTGGINLAGKLTLRESLSVLCFAKAAVGSESGLAQACCALGIPHAVVAGGGHFGRFLPYSPLTHLAVHPLDCFLCNWSCPHASVHCIQDLRPEVLSAALRASLAGCGSRPRLFQGDPSPGQANPSSLDLAPSIDAEQVEYIRVPTTSPLPNTEPTPIRTTVICGVWHRDPHRWERLQQHQACLDAQSRPVERLYVFDGGDQAPPWLKGQWVATSRPLGLYEAWDLAFHLARTEFVMNLNLDDRLATDAVALLEGALDDGADLAGGDWLVCFSQAETDLSFRSEPALSVPFHPEWPPVHPTRLGSGTGERGTYGPATLWRLAVRKKLPRYPWRFKDGSPIRIIGDAVWWDLLLRTGHQLARIPRIIGRYHSHPGDQAEFRDPGGDEQTKASTLGIELL